VKHWHDFGPAIKTGLRNMHPSAEVVVPACNKPVESSADQQITALKRLRYLLLRR
jgi:hypothetical protein